MKVCTKCGEEKELEEFTKDKKCKNGRTNICKNCARLIMKFFKNHISQMYGGMKKHCKTRIKNENINYSVDFTKDQFTNWLMENNYKELHVNWAVSNFDIMFTPSVDRLNDYIGYSFDNIQLVTWKENKNKAYKDRKKGKNNKLNKAIIQYDLDGNKLNEFHSIRDAGRYLKVKSPGTIYKVCSDKYPNNKIAFGFKWAFKE